MNSNVPMTQNAKSAEFAGRSPALTVLSQVYRWSNAIPTVANHQAENWGRTPPKSVHLHHKLSYYGEPLKLPHSIEPLPDCRIRISQQHQRAVSVHRWQRSPRCASDAVLVFQRVISSIAGLDKNCELAAAMMRIQQYRRAWFG